MPEPFDSAATRTAGPTPGGGDAPHRRAQLVIVEDGSSRVVPLPAAGFLRIGRTSDSDLVIAHPSVSREHARIMIADGVVRIADQGSHNGTRVNGEAVAGARALVSGDVVSVGEVTVVFHAGRRPIGGRRIEPPEVFEARLEDEVERAVSCDRPLALAVVSLGKLPVDKLDLAHVGAVLRPVDIFGRGGDTQLLIMLPERTPTQAQAALVRVLEAIHPMAPEATGGVATCPADGCDAEALLVVARGASRGGMTGSGRLELDGRTVILADPSMVRLFELIKRLAAADLPVLLLGETGVGKENAAFAVHHYSARRKQPFLTLNCAAIPDTLVESELFGHEKGAFSGAQATHVGILERTAGGTLFLDEVGEFSPAVQAKLLRALELKKITRLGDTKERVVDARIVAATNRDLEAEVSVGRFRQDLYFRLCAATVVIPPLRERPTEIPILARTFLAEACAAAKREPMELSAAALQALARHAWPGNVRELRNVMHFLAAAVTSWNIDASDLPPQVGKARASLKRPDATPPPLSSPTPTSTAVARPLADEIRDLERVRMREALTVAAGIKTKAAQLLGMPIRTFTFKLKQYGIGGDSPDDDDGENA